MTSKMDELSDSLDKLNTGQAPHSSDEEISELLEVAALLRKADIPARPPEHVMTAAVQRAAEGLNKNQGSRRNTWLYSGLLGAAAALMIFVGIHGFPSIQEVSDKVTPASQPMAAAPSESADSITRPAVMDASDKPSNSVSPSTLPSRTGAIPPTVLPSPSSPSVPSPVKPDPDSRVERLAPESSQSMKAVKRTATDTATVSPLKTLTLPGKKPDSVIKYPEIGMIRQVFDSGSSNELIITQRSMPQADRNDASPKQEKSLMDNGKTSPTSANEPTKVVLILHGQEVTLEGRQTAQELTELAKTLLP